MLCPWVNSSWRSRQSPMHRLRLTKNTTACRLQTNFRAVIVQGKSSGNNLISVTFVEVQLGSGVLCVAQGAAQSHGKEGEDQRVSAHQLPRRFGNMFLFWLAHVQNGASQDKSNDEFSLVLKHHSLHSESNQWLMVWTGRRGSRAKQTRRFRIPSCAAVSPSPTQNRGYNKYCISTRKPRNMEFIDARAWTRACQGNHRNPPLLTVKKLGFFFSFPGRQSTAVFPDHSKQAQTNPSFPCQIPEKTDKASDITSWTKPSHKTRGVLSDLLRLGEGAGNQAPWKWPDFGSKGSPCVIW